jgi:phage tail sheath protein FI
MTTEDVHAVQLALVSHCEYMGDRLAILDCPPEMTPALVREWRTDVAGYDSAFAAAYYPWIQVYDPDRGGGVFVPPCGHIAGVYARTDLVRGFHHAPANQPIIDALAVETALLPAELDVLNPVGVNAIIPSVGRGLLVWGNRTLSSDPSRRFIHQRRVIAFVMRNIRRATEWAIFERPDDETLGPRIAADVRELLLLLWRSGALWGHSPEAAFWVSPEPVTVDNIVYVDCEVALEQDWMSRFRLVYNLS